MRISKMVLAFGLALAFSAAARAGTVVYDSLPSPLPAGLPSLDYQATQTAEFGDAVFLAGGYSGTNDYTVTVGLTDSALQSDYMTQQANGSWTENSAFRHVTMNSAGFTYPLTLTLYGAVPADPGLGSPIASETVNAFIPWLPADYPADSSILFTVSFNFTDVTLPNEFIYGLSFNTENYGTRPTWRDGPYDYLGFALSSAVTVGEQVTPGTVFWNTQESTDFVGYPPGYFQQTNPDPDNGPVFTGGIPAVEISIAPEPASMIFFATGLVAVGGYVARRRMLRKA